MAGPVGHFRAAKNARVIIEATTLKKSVWDLTLRGDDLDTTTFESSGVEQGTIGIVGIDWSCGANWDAQANNLTDPPGLYPRDDLGDVKLYENTTDNTFWDLPQNRVLSSKNGAEVRGLVTFSSECKLNGPGYSLPTGSV